MATTNWADLVKKAKEAPDSSPLPAGEYKVKVESAEFKQSSTGKDMYVVVYVVTEGQHAGRKIWHRLVVSPESPVALSIFFRHMAVLGVSEDFLITHGSDPAAVCAKLIDAMARVKYGPQKKKPEYGEVKDLAPIDGVVSGGGSAPAAGAAAPPKAPF